jgi:hypothetical protein
MDPKLSDMIRKIGQKYLKANKEIKILVGMKMLGQIK